MWSKIGISCQTKEHENKAFFMSLKLNCVSTPTSPKQIVKTTSTKPNLITVPNDVQNRVKTSIHCIDSLTDSKSTIRSLQSISENERPKKLEKNKPQITNYCVFIKPRNPCVSQPAVVR